MYCPTDHFKIPTNFMQFKTADRQVLRHSNGEMFGKVIFLLASLHHLTLVGVTGKKENIGRKLPFVFFEKWRERERERNRMKNGGVSYCSSCFWLFPISRKHGRRKKKRCIVVAAANVFLCLRSFVCVNGWFEFPYEVCKCNVCIPPFLGSLSLFPKLLSQKSSQINKAGYELESKQCRRHFEKKRSNPLCLIRIKQREKERE